MLYVQFTWPPTKAMVGSAATFTPASLASNAPVQNTYKHMQDRTFRVLGDWLAVFSCHGEKCRLAMHL
jgi:hypothetical protein